MKRVAFGSAAIYGSKDLIADAAGPVIEAWKDNVVELPETHADDVAWEAEWMNAIMSKGSLEVPRIGAVPVATICGFPDAVASVPSQSESHGQPDIVNPMPGGSYAIPIPLVGGNSSMLRSRFHLPGSQSVRSSTNIGLTDLQAPPCNAAEPSAPVCEAPGNIETMPAIMQPTLDTNAGTQPIDEAMNPRKRRRNIRQNVADIPALAHDIGLSSGHSSPKLEQTHAKEDIKTELMRTKVQADQRERCLQDIKEIKEKFAAKEQELNNILGCGMLADG